MITYLTPAPHAVLDLCTATQRQFAENSRDYAVTTFDWRNLTQTADPDCSLPAPVHFSLGRNGRTGHVADRSYRRL